MTNLLHKISVHHFPIHYVKSLYFNLYWYGNPKNMEEFGIYSEGRSLCAIDPHYGSCGVYSRYIEFLK